MAAVDARPVELDVWLAGAAAGSSRSYGGVIRIDPVAGVCEELRRPLALASNAASEAAQTAISSALSL